MAPILLGDSKPWLPALSDRQGRARFTVNPVGMDCYWERFEELSGVIGWITVGVIRIPGPSSSEWRADSVHVPSRVRVSLDVGLVGFDGLDAQIELAGNLAARHALAD